MVRAVAWLLASYLLLGLAQVAVQPPWEGFDEIAHYSYIQQLADSWRLPRLGTARVSADAEAYERKAPLPYAYEPLGGTTYEAFFAGPRENLDRTRTFIHGVPEEPRRYSPGAARNWEAQHPPLYYLLLSPVYLSTRQLSWATHMLALRAASFLLAWAALAMGAWTCLTAVPSNLDGSRVSWEWSAVGTVIWPTLLPSWFPEMGRVGNDSLCALILAGVWWLTVRACSGRLSLGRAAVLGLLLGAGCLTKVLFVPVTVGCLGFWLTRAYWLGGRRGLVAIAPQIIVTVLVAGAVAGWWYLWNWTEYGVPVGDLEAIELHRGGGLLRGLAENASVLGFLKAPLIMGVTLVWAGTASVVRVPLAMIIPMGATLLLAVGASLAVLRRFRPAAVVWLPAWLGALTLLGLAHRVLIRMALLGKGQPAYYLHVLAVTLGAAVGLGLGWLCGKAGLRRCVAAGVAFALSFAVLVFWAQVMTFSGLTPWSEDGAVRVYGVLAFCREVPRLPEALSRLAVLAHAKVGLAAWMLGAPLMLVGLRWAWTACRKINDVAAGCNSTTGAGPERDT